MQFNDQKPIKNLLQNISKSQTQTPKKIPSKKTHKIIRNNDFFFKNEVSNLQKIKQIPEFYTRYYIFQHFSPLKIGEFKKEQHHLENYENISNQLNTPESYALVTYPFSHINFCPDFDTFFSPLIKNLNENPKIFFHYFFSSYIHLAESILLLNEKGVYPFLIKEETIFFNREKIPILSLPLTFSLSSTISIDEFLILMNHLLVQDLDFLSIEFHTLFLLERENLDSDSTTKKNREKMANECISVLPTLNHYQLSLLYLKQLDKIREKKQFNKFQKLITNLYECFQNVVNTKSDQRENLQETKEKIENLFLGFS